MNEDVGIVPKSIFFFPLRSNTGYYESPQGYLGLVDRIKQASLLYDLLIFEGGIYTSIIWDSGKWDVWHPPHMATENELQWLKDSFKPTGGESVLLVQAEGGEPLPLFSGEVIRRFQCEFHSILRNLGAESLPWIKTETFSLTEEGKQDARATAQSIGTEFRNSLPEVNRHLLSLIINNFCRDLVVTTDMNAAATVHTLHLQPLINKVGGSQASGFAALEVAVPNLSSLAWEEIIEVRAQPAWVEFRKKLLELELTVKTALPHVGVNELQFEVAVSQALIQELLVEIANYQPRTGEIIGNIAIDLIFGLIPLPGASAALTGIRGFGEMEKAHSSWITAFLKLRQSR